MFGRLSNSFTRRSNSSIRCLWFMAHSHCSAAAGNYHTAGHLASCCSHTEVHPVLVLHEIEGTLPSAYTDAMAHISPEVLVSEADGKCVAYGIASTRLLRWFFVFNLEPRHRTYRDKTGRSSVPKDHDTQSIVNSVTA